MDMVVLPFFVSKRRNVEKFHWFHCGPAATPVPRGRPEGEPFARAAGSCLRNPRTTPDAELGTDLPDPGPDRGVPGILRARGIGRGDRQDPALRLPDPVP